MGRWGDGETRGQGDGEMGRWGDKGTRGWGEVRALSELYVPRYASSELYVSRYASSEQDARTTKLGK